MTPREENNGLVEVPMPPRGEEVDLYVGPVKKHDNLSIPIAIVIAGALVAGAIIFSDSPKSAGQAADNIATRNQVGADTDTADASILAIRPDDHVLGNPNADVLIIEYSDTECPFCKQFHVTMKEIMDQYGKTGSVAWIYRHFPLDQIHPKARKEAEALECVNELGGNDAFWRYLDRIFEITPANNGLDLTQLPVLAKEVGIDVNRFNSCLSSGKYADRVESDFADGVVLGVKGTPYSIVWNRKTGKQMPLNGAYPFTNVKAILGAVSASSKPAPAQETEPAQ
jgi:protein-disulfide isomerase